MSLDPYDDKKLGGGEDNFTAAVEPGHQVVYGEEPEVQGGLKRQLKSRHVSHLPEVKFAPHSDEIDGNDLYRRGHWHRALPRYVSCHHTNS